MLQVAAGGKTVPAGAASVIVEKLPVRPPEDDALKVAVYVTWVAPAAVELRATVGDATCCAGTMLRAPLETTVSDEVESPILPPRVDVFVTPLTTSRACSPLAMLATLTTVITAVAPPFVMTALRQLPDRLCVTLRRV